MSVTSINEVVPRVAIVGGGQLGFLLCGAARALGIQTLIVTPDADAPALTIANEAFVVDYSVAGLAVRIAEWAYEQTEQANGQVWVAKDMFRHLGPEWRQLLVA